MSKPAIHIEGLGKQYNRVGGANGVTLREWLAQLGAPKKKELFWALKDLNLTVDQGEILGVIGRNGSGKSTMLKLLSRITLPSAGRAVINGRVASLLEVGTGFHHELTGRENIYLNGAILGMTRREVKEQFSAIVEFAGVEDFIETKVKHYSSGMYVRLAFSVAAHLRTEILLIDEVLAVGDAEFQKKSLGKMNEVVRENGRTILFVSHNLGLVQQLCDRVIGLDSGRLFVDSSPSKSVSDYYELISQHAFDKIIIRGPLEPLVERLEIMLNGLQIQGVNGISLNQVLEFTCVFHHQIPLGIKFHISIYREGIRLCTFQDSADFAIAGSPATSVFRLNAGQLRPGRYVLAIGGLASHNAGEYFWAEEAGTFTILEDWQHVNDPIDFGWIAPQAECHRLP